MSPMGINSVACCRTARPWEQVLACGDYMHVITQGLSPWSVGTEDGVKYGDMLIGHKCEALSL